MRWRVIAVAAAGVVAVKVALRPRLLHWGATAGERSALLPGDDLLPSADLVATRVITVGAPPQEVWPWVAQMGQGRGGLYSYDALENLVGCDMHSADEIVAAWQDIQVGDEFRLHPDVALVVAAVEPERALVVQGGVPMGDSPAPYDFTWAFVLRAAPGGTTRVVARERYHYRTPWAPLIVEPVSVASFVMTERMLRGIRDRAERAAVTPPGD